jgi:hypothetical protein|uniref:Uncharacterized protein n=1 Tax=viral metagenome TaxID=1070528 RepID=A0A6C0LKU1_9ZZZZ
MDDYYGDPLGPSSFPSASNYTYETSIYMNDRSDKNPYPRVYTEETRDKEIEDCEPCAGYSSQYYDKCYAKEGNQCIGRSYPQCMKTYPHCKQLQEETPILYKESGGGKEGFFSSNNSNSLLTQDNLLLIVVAFIVCVLLFSNNKKQKVFSIPFNPNLNPNPATIYFVRNT